MEAVGSLFGAVIIIVAVILVSNWAGTTKTTVVYQECKHCLHRQYEGFLKANQFTNCSNPFCKAQNSACPKCKKCSVCGN
jgi:hypothetical protein